MLPGVKRHNQTATQGEQGEGKERIAETVHDIWFQESLPRQRWGKKGEMRVENRLPLISPKTQKKNGNFAVNSSKTHSQKRLRFRGRGLDDGAEQEGSTAGRAQKGKMGVASLKTRKHW